MKHVYRKAAERIAKRNNWSCDAIEIVMGYNPTRWSGPREKYEFIFDLKDRTFGTTTLDCFTFIPFNDKEVQTARILALEFMHLWEQTGDE